MKVIAPLPITNARLIASNVTEDDYAEWDASTDYAVDAFVIVTGTTHKVYKAAQASGPSASPGGSVNPVDDDGTYWTPVSATNRWKAFDGKIADATSRSETITYEFAIDTLTTGIAFFGLSAATVRVQVFDASSPAVEVYDRTISVLDTTNVIDWFTYFFEPVVADTEALLADLPAYVGYEVHVTINNGSGTAKVGQIVLGRVYTLGQTIDGTSIGIEDFSRKERDAFGNATVLERAFAQEVDFNFALGTQDARRVQRILSDLRATPAVYFDSSDTAQYGTTVFGFYSDFDIPLSAGGLSFATLSIEGLV